MPSACILLALTPVIGVWVALFLRAQCRDRLIAQAGPIMEQGEHRAQWLQRSPLTDWLLLRFRRIRLLKSATLPSELQRQLRRFTTLTYVSLALLALVLVIAFTGHLIC
jgi:hypothetical protein